MIAANSSGAKNLRWRFLSRQLIGGGLFTLLAASTAPAQWMTENFSLKAGWNAIWLPLDCTHDVPEVILNNPAIEEVWRWERPASNTQFIDSPVAPVQEDAQWKVWKRGQPGATTLGSLTGNSGYLVRVTDGVAPFGFAIKGRPQAPLQQALPDGLNLLGFPGPAGGVAPTQSFARFYGFSSELKTNPPTYQYIGGPLSDVVPRNPALIGSLTATAVKRGQAYWVQTASHTGYYGPLSVTVSRAGGLDYGSGATTLSLRLKNVTDSSRVPPSTLTATLAPAPSEAPPTITPALPAVAGPVPLKLRGPLDASNGSFTLTALTGPVSFTLAPGQETEVVLVADRSAMTSTTGLVYQSLLKISDSLSLTNIDLGVRAVSTSLDGVWAGEARVSAVQQVLGTRNPNAAQNPAPVAVNAAAAFPLRLLLHRSSTGVTSLLQKVYLGRQVSNSVVSGIAGASENSLNALISEIPITRTGRLSSSHFHPAPGPLGQQVGTFGTGSTISFAFMLPFDDSANPFVHAYHPDHDNLGALNTVAPPTLTPGVESPQIQRSITLTFQAPPVGLNDPSWGFSTLGGTFQETVSGLRKESISVSGSFVLRRISDAPVLRLTAP